MGLRDQRAYASVQVIIVYVKVMPRICEVCGRGSLKSASRSHSNIATIKRQKVNLQTLVQGSKKLLACTSCIRTNTKTLLAKAKKANKK